MAVELSDRMALVLAAVDREQPVSEIASDLGVSVQAVYNMIRKLSRLGLVRPRKGVLPKDVRWGEAYYYEPTGAPMVYRPSIPPTAKFRLAYPVDSQRDLSVATIRHVLWPPRWSVQGVPILGLDGASGRSANDRLPEFRVVVVADLTVTDHTEDDAVVFLASTRRRWTQADTLLQIPEGVEPDTEGMTAVIACAINPSWTTPSTEGAHT